MSDRRDWTLVGVLVAIMAGLVALEAQAGPRNLAPPPSIRSLSVEAAPGDSVDVTATWTPALVRPGSFVADLHVLDVFDQDTTRFLVTDSVPAGAASGGTMSATVRIPADTSDTPSRACVQAFHQTLSSAVRCTDFTIPGRMILEDPGAPNVEVELDSLQTAFLDPDAGPTLALDEGETAGEMLAVAYIGGVPHACVTVAGVHGWFELASVQGGLLLSSSLDHYEHADPECGVRWSVGDSSVIALQAGVYDVPVEGQTALTGRLAGLACTSGSCR